MMFYFRKEQTTLTLLRFPAQDRQSSERGGIYSSTPENIYIKARSYF